MFRIDINNDLLSLTTLGSLKLVVIIASDVLTTALPFNGQLNSGSAVRFLSEKISIVIHRNIRFFLPLMVNVEVPVSYQLSRSCRRHPASETQS